MFSSGIRPLMAEMTYLPERSSVSVCSDDLRKADGTAKMSTSELRTTSFTSLEKLILAVSNLTEVR